VFVILLAQRRDNSALAATVAIGTIIGLTAFASADPSGAQTFTRSAVLALPVWGAFAISTFLLTRVLDWRLAADSRDVLVPRARSPVAAVVSAVTAA
jgi:hypothetical protein